MRCKWRQRSGRFAGGGIYVTLRINENTSNGEVFTALSKAVWRRLQQEGPGSIMMSLPFFLFACGLGAAWTHWRSTAMGFWVAGVLVLLVLFRVHANDVLNIAL
ncbi:DUF5993 family protein [Methyloligella sp. 2.7D]|uniref:DUF5993 family protein n=1 Tax=Methyloligella sp. 2.7D TaxID=3085160 RepID=UPI003FA5BC54